jgi:glycosyltransferase involved in cell wall biosynthesis
LVTDAWNFAVTAIKYMSDLFEIPVEIHGIWHAGAYDPSDILGMKMSPEWSSHQEKAWYYACDYNYFATDFHMKMFLENLDIPRKDEDRAVRSGQPYNYVARKCADLYNFPEKEDVIVFTHRLNDDKQPDIFRDLVNHLPDDWGYVITQDHNYTKEEYYEVLGRSKIAFSCSLHENLGIGMAEATMCGCVPVMPGRASYPEIYRREFIYSSDWTKDWDSYVQNRDKLVDFVVQAMNNYNDYHSDILKKQVSTLRDDFLDAKIMIDKLFNVK